MSLIDPLKQIEDYRAPVGRRYPLWLMILLAILGSMSECYGYAALEDFCVRPDGAVCECFGIAVPRLPSDSTFRRLFEQLDFERVVRALNPWAGVQMPIEAGDWLALPSADAKRDRRQKHQGHTSATTERRIRTLLTSCRCTAINTVSGSP